MTDRSVASRYWSSPRTGVTIVMRGSGVTRDGGIIVKFYDPIPIRGLRQQGKLSMLWLGLRAASSLEYCPPLYTLFTRQRKSRLFRHSTKNPSSHILAHRRSVLEPMP